MKTGNTTAAYLARHGRLLALCGLSLLLHAIVIAWLDARIAAPLPTIGAPPLAVRLGGPRAPAAAPAPALASMEAAAPAPATAPPLPAIVLPAPVPMRPPGTAAAPAPTLSAPGTADAAPTPSRYRVAMPPSATLVYEVHGAGATPGEATLAWESDGIRYHLALDGILGAIESEGGSDDAGIAPLRARYRRGTGVAAIAFDRERGAIVLESLGRSVQDTPGSQDGATLLMQLAGIGIADPDQLQDTVDIYVGRADGAAVERYQVLGMEQVTTALGALEALHLARAGAARLEIWLAPGQGWLPVQLRATAPDGTVRMQVLKEIRRAPAG
ncbi:MAG: DUF3108 domain-containing protein [Janthinobacterium lividum]